jgi:Tfp pilus assembly protein PilN
MIRINLIRGKRKKRKELNLDFLYFLVPVAVALAVFFFHRTFSERKDALQSEIGQANQTIARLKREIGEVDKFKVRKAELQKKVDIISGLQTGRMGAIRVFEALSASIPEKCWIDSLKLDGPNVKLSGLAVNNTTIANFMTALAQSGRFRDVQLGSADQATYLDAKLVKFNLTFQTVDKIPAVQKNPG